MTKRSLLALVLIAGTLQAEITLPKLIGSGMVLQRESEVPIWGLADPGEDISITCSWIKKTISIKANADGEWTVNLTTGQAGGPHSITLVASHTVTLEDVLFGEVWLGSGQSNMEMPVAPVSNAYTGVNDWEAELAAANHPQIRFFQVGNIASKEPQKDVQPGVFVYGVNVPPSKWQSCQSSTVKHFSSTAYFFARKLHRELGVPVGVIDASWGGSAIEPWIGKKQLAQAGFEAMAKRGDDQPDQPRAMGVPTRLYNGMIAPLMPFRLKGVIWYQGESNHGRPKTYKRLMQALVAGWRHGFKSDFSFYYVQIAPFKYKQNAAYLREQQLQALSIRKSGMVVTADIGNLKDIHPKNKQEVGRRLALKALANDYGRKITYAGPRYQKMKRNGGSVTLYFDHVGMGLVAYGGGALKDFEIAGVDRKFVKATAVIEGSQVVVESPSVKRPVAVRYAFSSQSRGSLMNKDGLPASPFRTDDWE
ncbi:MAG: sialate O-acetylesterase [Verrucomicrobiae bacterium]|nr:sialate O-acetylesterase [Verrucomicrobiae bacterium]NNJ42390.1 sialate O-acetylesterase [Akkermansiaceae bacterium]